MKTLKKETVQKVCRMLENFESHLKSASIGASAFKYTALEMAEECEGLRHEMPDANLIGLDEAEKELLYFALKTEIDASARKATAMCGMKQARGKMEENHRKSNLIHLQTDIEKNA